LQQRHVPISAIPEGFLANRTMDSVASLAGAASHSGEMRLAILRFAKNALLKYYVNMPQFRLSLFPSKKLPHQIRTIG